MRQLFALALLFAIPSFAQTFQSAVFGACINPSDSNSCSKLDKSECMAMQWVFLGGSCQTFVKGQIILYPAAATSGRLFRMTRPVERVGVVQDSNKNEVTVQEINYPTRYGQKVFVQTPEGDKPFDGTYKIPATSDELIPQALSVVASDGTVITRGSRIPIRIGRTKHSGYVLYVFNNGKKSYAAITDEAGWACYSESNESCYTQGYVRILVRTVNAGE